MTENFYARHCLTCNTGNPNIYVCVFIYSYFWALDTVHLCAILDVLLLFSTRLAAMQLWRRKSMQWVEAPMENSLNLLSVTTPGLSSGRRSVLWKRGGERKWKGKLDCCVQSFLTLWVEIVFSLLSPEHPMDFTMSFWIMVAHNYNANIWMSKDNHPGNK